MSFRTSRYVYSYNVQIGIRGWCILYTYRHLRPYSDETETKEVGYLILCRCISFSNTISVLNKESLSTRLSVCQCKTLVKLFCVCSGSRYAEVFAHIKVSGYGTIGSLSRNENRKISRQCLRWKNTQR